MTDYRIISADAHTVEPPDLWEKWLERKHHDSAPKLVDDGDGGDAWIYMGGYASTTRSLRDGTVLVRYWCILRF